MKTDFVRVDVGRTWGRTQTDMLMQVSPKEEVLTRPLKPGGIPLDVALIMLDSVSNAQFRRKMPHTLEYLNEQPTTVFLQGETIVGDGTTAQLSAILTGIAEKEQPEARKSEPNAESVDKWRWIFKDFKEKGYATLFTEDAAKFGMFTYRLLGFKEPPSDHYGRPFWLEAMKVRDKYCQGSQAVHNISLEYLLSFYREYKDKRKFSLLAMDLCHDDQSALGYADEDLKSFIKKFDEESFSTNTLLIIFGDHGARFAAQRKTIQGKLEERLPFLSLTFPKWFKEKYPDLYINLIHNSKVLTTPFDVYATLRHILSYPSYPSGITTGQSLFNRIDKENRTCENAGVEEHWCPCLNFEEISTDDPLIEKSAELIISHINNLMFQKHSGLGKLCHELVLKEITHAYRDMPSGKLQFLKKTHRDEKCDSCGLSYGDKSVNTLAKNTMYHLQLATSPNDAFYEATVKMKGGEPSLIGDISRINAYGDQPHCIMDRVPLLRKYCYCLRQRSR